MTLPTTCCEADRNFSKIYIQKTLIKHATGMNYLSNLSTENVTTLLSYEEAIKRVCRQRMRVKSIIKACQAVNKNVIFLEFVMWYLSDFLNFCTFL
jgi:hypothetical protein